MKRSAGLGALAVSAAALALLLASPPLHAQFVAQGGKLVGSGAVGTARQGTSVAVSADGNTLIVGGPHDNNSTGCAWVYTRSAGAWTQQARLIAADAIGAAAQGTSVALSADGNTAIVGGPADNGYVGAAWVFTRSGGLWKRQSKLVGTGAVGSARQGRRSPSRPTETPRPSEDTSTALWTARSGSSPVGDGVDAAGPEAGREPHAPCHAGGESPAGVCGRALG